MKDFVTYVNSIYIPYAEAKELNDLGYDMYIEFYKDSDEEFYDMRTPDDAPCILWQNAFRWFEENQSIYVDRLVETTPNEILDITYMLKSFRFPPIEVEFDELYDSFDRDKANLTCLRKLIEIVKDK